MLSKCPSCAKDIEHEDFLFEVTCSCGMAFNPFYDSGVSAGASEDQAPAPDAENFSEASDAFREIVAFAEVGETPQKAATAPKATAQKPAAKTAATVGSESSLGGGSSSAPATDERRIIVPGDKIEGYLVENYHPPVSVSAAVDWEAEAPLAMAFENAWNACLQSGGNALLHVRWELSPDGGRCLLAGVPVRCQRV